MFRSFALAPLALLLAAATVSTPTLAEPAPQTLSALAPGALKLLPLELTAFGDFRYKMSRGRADHFEIGSVELDSALTLSPHVMVSAALAYNPDGDSFGLGAFTVDGSLFGPEEKHLVKTDLVDDSGVIFGKFDVPFGIAYLEYPATENRFVALPDAVMATHGGWNDLGTQAYITTTHFEGTAYLVNGKSLEDERANALGKTAKHAWGGRFGVKPVEALTLGASFAKVMGTLDTPLFGADLSATLGPVALKNEYIYRSSAHTRCVHAYYVEALAHHSVLFGGTRYETTYTGREGVDHAVGVTFGAEVFPQAEIRLAHLRTLETGAETTFLQLVGGSIWQPTGLRR